MLILTRKIGETLRIGDDVSIVVLGYKGGQVRLGVDAPRSVAVHREEIYTRIQAEKSEAEANEATSSDGSFEAPEGLGGQEARKKSSVG